MLHSPAEVVKWILITGGLGSDPTLGQPWPVSASGEPGSPDSTITIYNTAGGDKIRLFFDGSINSPNGLQVRVRALSDADAFNKIQTIWTYLAKQVFNQTVTIGTGTVSNYQVLGLVNFGDILSLGKEVPASRRSLYTFNVLIRVNPLN